MNVDYNYKLPTDMSEEESRRQKEVSDAMERLEKEIKKDQHRAIWIMVAFVCLIVIGTWAPFWIANLIWTDGFASNLQQWWEMPTVLSLTIFALFCYGFAVKIFMDNYF